jgi:hypothetical protein
MNCKLIDPLLVFVSVIIFTLLPYFALLPMVESFGQTPELLIDNFWVEIFCDNPIIKTAE